MDVLCRARHGLQITVLAALVPMLSGCDVAYLAQSAYAEARLLWKRKPIETVLQRPGLNQDIRSKLQLVLQVRSFASDRLDLNVGGAYSTVSPVDQSAVTWVLMAAEPDSLKPHTWYFPIVGEVPYKGYFDETRAEQAAASLQTQGLDTFIRPAVAFSSLGYFNDPLLSNLLGLDHVVLAGVIIHELFHRTYFLAGDVMFDESAANYIGSRGAAVFFEERDGANSNDAATARAIVASDSQFGHFLEREEARLNDLYHSDLPRAEILKRRVGLFHQIQADYTKLKPSLSGLERFDLDKVTLNNAVLINFQLYFHNLDDFAALDRQHNCDLRATIASVISLAKANPDDAFGAIHQAVKSAPKSATAGCLN